MQHLKHPTQMVPQDPDDGQGHGTHVAGIALGTGDSSRVHIGAAPGSFLVDVKVLTDSGGTNSQNSLNGIQWMINNVDTDWGNGAKEFKSVRCHLVQLETQLTKTMAIMVLAPKHVL